MIGKRISLGSCLLVLVAMLVSSCVIAPPREGYFDRAHHRYYHDHGWHACVANDIHCR